MAYTPISLQKTPRLKLAVRKKPYFTDIAPGISLGYRRNVGAGAWLVRVADGKGGNKLSGFAKADDFQLADNNTVLDYKQAHQRAGQLAGAEHVAAVASTAIPVSVDEAITAYEFDLEARGAGRQNAQSIRFYLTDHPIIKRTPVSLLTQRTLKEWRNSLVTKGGPNGKVSRDTANRVCHVFKTALNLAASQDERIKNINAWKFGLANLPPNDTSDVKDNKIMSDELIAEIVLQGWRDNDETGAQFQTLAETGTRESQMLQCRVDDLQEINGMPRLLMPSSKKGRSRQVERRPVPITRQLYVNLKRLTVGKEPTDMIFTKLTHIERNFRAITEGLKKMGAKAELTPYAFRHSSIVRMLKKSVPLSIVASHHDTSAKVIQKHYARFITSDTDDVTRAALPEFTMPKTKITRIGKAS